MSESMRYDDHPEKGNETFPSQEDVEAFMKGILQRDDYTILSQTSDANGASELEIQIVIGDRNIRLQYERAKCDSSSPSFHGKEFSASIHLVEYDSDGKVIGGKQIANYLDGKWSDIRELSS